MKNHESISLSGHTPNVQSWTWSVCVKSLTLEDIWLEHMLISGGDSHLTNFFCKIELDSTQNFNRKQDE